MAFMEWKEDLRVNISKIDEQHKKLIELINNLHEAMKTGKGKEACGKVLKELTDYTVYHFSMEEDYMKQTQYPESPGHMTAHKDLIAQVIEFQKGFESGKIGLSMDLFDFLNKWLVDHIMATDKKFGQFLRLKGIQ